MQPQDFLERLTGLQAAANNVTITCATLSHYVGEYVEFLGSGEDFANAHKYVEQIQRCLNANAQALKQYCDATAHLAGGDNYG